VTSEFIADEKAIWQLVVHYARATTSLGKLARHDLRRTCAKLCRKSGGELEQVRVLLGHAPIRTTKRYLGTEQKPLGRGERRVGPRDGLSYDNDCGETGHMLSNAGRSICLENHKWRSCRFFI